MDTACRTDMADWLATDEKRGARIRERHMLLLFIQSLNKNVHIQTRAMSGIIVSS